MPINESEARSSRTPRVIGSNPLRPLAAELAVGQVVAATLDGKSVPARITRLILRPNGSVFADVDVFLSGVVGRMRWDGHRRVEVLPQHFGICVECGALSPCAHQTIEENAARLQSEADPINSIELDFYSADAEPDRRQENR